MSMMMNNSMMGKNNSRVLVSMRWDNNNNSHNNTKIIKIKMRMTLILYRYNSANNINSNFL